MKQGGDVRQGRRARQRRKDGTHTRARFQDGRHGGWGASPDSKIPLPPVRRAFPCIREGLADGQAGVEGKPSLALPSQASAVLLVRADSINAGGRLLEKFG